MERGHTVLWVTPKVNAVLRRFRTNNTRMLCHVEELLIAINSVTVTRRT